MTPATHEITYGTNAEYPPIHGYISAILDNEKGDPADIILLLDWWAHYSDSYADAIKEAFATSPAEIVGVQKEHLFHIPSRTWQCLCQTDFATLPMLAFRRSAAPVVLGLLRRGTNIGPALWKIDGLRRKLIPNKGPDGRLRCVCFRGFPGDQSVVNGPLKRKDAALAWLGRQMGTEQAEKWMRLALEEAA